MRKYDAILVPGGGVREGGILPSWVQSRLDLAIELYQGSYIVTLSAGTPHHPPPLDAGGFPIFESVAAAKYLVQAGIPPDRVITEMNSYDTIGNAFFSRVVHVDPEGLRRLLVITSDFHLRRTRLAFNWVYHLTPEKLHYELHFKGVADESMDRSMLAERQARELESLHSLTALTKRITTMKDFHHWIFTEHNAYKSNATSFGAHKVMGAALGSY